MINVNATIKLKTKVIMDGLDNLHEKVYLIVKLKDDSMFFSRTIKKELHTRSIGQHNEISHQVFLKECEKRMETEELIARGEEMIFNWFRQKENNTLKNKIKEINKKKIQISMTIES